MSILKLIADQKKIQNKYFGIIQGVRGAGKTCTTVGTLPGKVLLIQAAKESGAASALTLAKERGNTVDIIKFYELDNDNDKAGEFSLKTIIKNLSTAYKSYDHIVIDSIIEITDMAFDLPEIQSAIDKNVWEGYSKLAQKVTKYLDDLLSLTKDINVFLLLSVEERIDPNGKICEVKPSMRGQASTAFILKKANMIITIKSFDIVAEDGKSKIERRLILKNYNKYINRLDGILDSKNPGVLPPDMSLVLNLIKGE